MTVLNFPRLKNFLLINKWCTYQPINYLAEFLNSNKINKSVLFSVAHYNKYSVLTKSLAPSINYYLIFLKLYSCSINNIYFPYGLLNNSFSVNIVILVISSYNFFF